MGIKSEYLYLDNKNLIAQRSARNMVKRDSIIIFISYSILFILFLAIITQKHVTIYIALLILLVLYISFKLISNWRGWLALQIFDIHCPHCHRPLFMEKMNIIKSPSNKCPHCGRVALASIKQLKM
jgi:hypothetical protein